MSRAVNHTKCSVNGCAYSYRLGHKYCGTHYMRLKRYGDANFRKIAQNSGRKQHPLYVVFCSMRQRCYDKNSRYYEDYGGRGIQVCERWLGLDGFDNFVIDMGERPMGYTLERIDNNRDYSPVNCCWATRKEQANNRRSNKLFTIGSTTKNIKQWADEVGLSYKIVHQRIYRDGRSIQEALGMAIEA